MKVAIIGCGNIGRELASFIDQHQYFHLHSLTEINENNLRVTMSLLREEKPKILTLIEAVCEAELIIEAANKEVAGKLLCHPHIDTPGKKILIMSTCALIEYKKCLKKIRNCEVIIPSGAIAGLDAIKAIASQINKLTLTTTKHPSSLKNSPYMKKRPFNWDTLENKEVIFQGGLDEAIMGFPQNINVAASLFLASRYKDMRIKIIADPQTKYNTHEVICWGSFGKITTKTENFPSQNPKTSSIAIASAISVLNNMHNHLKIGY